VEIQTSKYVDSLNTASLS